jgi:hypothetical protein
MIDLLSHRLGTVTLEPAGPVEAGSVGQWRLVYTVGSYGIDEHGTIKLVQRLVSDWEVPQFDRPDQPGYTTVSTTGQARLALSYQRKAYHRPWTAGLVIDLYDGFLAPGDTVTITLGDQSQGSPGIRAQTFQETAHEFRLLVDPTNAHLVERLPTSPLVPIVAGPPLGLVCIVPSQATLGQPLEIFVKGQDRWSNPTAVPKELTLTWAGTAEITIDGRYLTFHTPGSGQVVASVMVGSKKLSCRSNPITALSEPPPFKKYWGDLHAQTAATVGTGSEAEYFTFARDVARLDFTSHQGNDFQMSDADWQRLNDTVRAFHQEGRFVVFPGYEWSANTPAGGDRNVFYLEEGLPILRSKHWQIRDTPEDDLTPAHPADVLFRRIRERIDPGKVLLGAHVGGRYADIRRHFDQALGGLVEVVSCWGVFEWLLWDAFEMGYMVGVMANSDGHKGRPGAEGPGAGEFGINGGLTCVLAETLTRQAIFAGLKARRCYGTTGPRIDLSFTIADQPMGAVIAAPDGAEVRATVRGTAPLESLSLYQGRTVIETVQPPAFANLAGSRRLRISWRGSRIRGRDRRVTWDGHIRLHGPQLVSATTFAFDAATDGIVSHSKSELLFKSSTTGDTDGLDLILDQTNQGRVDFVSAAGVCTVELAELPAKGGKQRFDFGGLDMAVCFERYPAQLSGYELSLSDQITPPPGQTTPYFVKAVQSDGHMAWSSPIYVTPT